MQMMTIRDALNAAMHDLMAAHDTMVVMGEDIVGGTSPDGADELGGPFGVTRGLAAKFGRERVIDTPISEVAFLGMATGAAMTGLRPVVEIMFCDFLGVCFDQLMNQTAKLRFLSAGRVKLPLVIRTTMGAGDGSGATHSQSLHGLAASIPGLIVAAPATAADAAGLLKAAFASDAPVMLFEHKGLYGLEGAVADGLPAVKLGEGRVALPGRDITIVATSAMLHQALVASDQLADAGIKAEVIDPRTIQPLDAKLILSSVAKTGHLLVVDEGAAFAGFADAVLSLVAREGFGALKAAPKALTPLHTPVPYGRAAEAAWLPNADNIVTAARAMLAG
jgi:pyruvate/2-oxoglutarate/acetoin dehydrogenase E1 component